MNTTPRPGIRAATLIAVLGLAAAASAQVPAYSGLELVASVGTPNVVLTSSADFTNNTPRLNNDGVVALRYTNTATDSIVWIAITHTPGSPSPSTIVQTLPLNGGFVSTTDPSINSASAVAWSQGSPTVGLYRALLPATGAFLASQPLGANRFENPIIADNGMIGSRVGFTNGQAWASYDPATNSTAIHLAEAAIAPSSGIGFLFTPAFNALRQIAGNSATGTSQGPQRILRVEANGTITVVAAANAIDPASTFLRFDASAPAINDLGDVAFIGERTAAAGGGRGVWLWRSSNGTLTNIAQQGAGDIAAGSNNIEFFPPSMNSNRVVAFRAFDANNRRAIWVGDGTTLTKLATRGSPITNSPSSIFVGRTDTSADFGGSISINHAGDVAFNASFNNGTTLTGRGVVLARAIRPQTCSANCDGSTTAPVLGPADFSCFLAKFRAGDAYANCDGSTDLPVLGPADFSCFLAKFRAGC